MSEPADITMADAQSASDPMNISINHMPIDNDVSNEHIPDPDEPIYPKPGNGIMARLPPETEDLDWRVDDDFETFSHVVYSGATGTANGEVGGGTGAQKQESDGGKGSEGKLGVSVGA